MVWAHSVFDQGTVNSGVLSDGTKHSYQGFNRPSSILVTEAFLIEDGKIRRVEMIGPSATYHLQPAWPGRVLSGELSRNVTARTQFRRLAPDRSP